MRVIGIDLGIRKLSMAYYDTDLMTMEVFEHSVPAGSPRQHELKQLAFDAQDTTAWFDPDYVFIEDGVIGNNRKYSIQLAQTAGAVLSALGEYKNVLMANNKTWKKELIGNGNANKELVSKWLEAHHSTYASLCGSQDDRDAMCVALYGAGVVERAGQLAAHRLVPE